MTLRTAATPSDLSALDYNRIRMNMNRPPRYTFNSNLPKSSIVSYPDRCPLWGDARYRGNCDGRLFVQLVQRYRPRSVADPMEGSGTTRHAVAWLVENTGANIDFWGGDLRHGFNLLRQDIPGRHDFIWIHPPYWNIIRYGEHADDLSSFDDYQTFASALRVCLLRCAQALEPGGRLAVLIGDVRRKGKYVPIIRDVMNLEAAIGPIRSVIIKAQHNCRSDKVANAAMEDVPIRHEYCVIFKSGAAPHSSRKAA